MKFSARQQRGPARRDFDITDALYCDIKKSPGASGIRYFLILDAPGLSGLRLNVLFRNGLLHHHKIKDDSHTRQNMADAGDSRNRGIHGTA